MVIALLILSAMFRAIQEHAKWRNSPGWSILYGSWWLRTDHPLNLDGYHIASALHVGLLFVAALLWDWSFWWLPVAWIGFYQVNNLFYHVVFTHPDNWDLPIFKI